jgi:hypothetical protein
MTIRLLAPAFVALLVSGISAPALAGPTLDFLTFSVPLSEGEDVMKSFPTGSGLQDPLNPARTNVNVAGPLTDSFGRVFTICGASTGTGCASSVTPTVFGVSSTLATFGFTNALITYTSKGNAPTAPVDLLVDYGFLFSLPSDSQTYGIQIGGTYNRPPPGTNPATGDSILVQGFVGFFNSDGVFQGDTQISVDKKFTVSTINKFGPTTPPKGTEPISCSLTFPGALCSPGSAYLLETFGTIHFDQVGDTLKIPNSWDVAAGPADLVDAFLDAAAAADAAALPEPNSLLLVLGSGLAGLGLFRLRHARGRAGQDRRD